MNAYLETRSYRSNLPVTAFYAIDNNFLAHWHIDVEMVYVCEGQIRIGVNKESKILNHGELAVFGSTDIHYYDSKELHSRIIVLIFRPELVGSPGGWPEKLRFNPAFIKIQWLNTAIRKRIVDIFRDISDEMQQNGPYYQLYINGRILELCALLLRHIPTRVDHGQSGKLPDIHRIQAAIQYLEENYRSVISLTDISRRVNLSPYYFSKLFFRFTGTTFKEYLSRVRIARAEQLIKTGRQSIIDISFDCGFNSVRTFNRTYKAIKGFPPSETRPAGGGS